MKQYDELSDAKRRYLAGGAAAENWLPLINPNGKPTEETDEHWAMRGSREEKRKRWEEWQSHLDRKHREHPKLGVCKLRRIVAKHFKVSDRTVRLRTRSPF
ncbi:MAG: hypothetical protein ABSG85_18805 [Spirochaetia bacterium]|jgi:hypothetical protein